MGYIGWSLDERERDFLLKEIPPMFPDVIAEHVTLEIDVDASHKFPQSSLAPRVGKICGMTVEGELQAVVVEIDGTMIRPDGSIFHITWSLNRDAGYKPRMSNDAIDRCGWEPIGPYTIKLIPTFFPSETNG